MKHRRNWAIGIILAVTAGFVALQNVAEPAVNESPLTQSITDTPTIITTDTPIATLAYEGCSFMWAYHNAPELTEKLRKAVKALNENAYASVSLYGEDCIYANGHATFSAMETDFYINNVVFTTDDMSNKELFGNWMKQVLPIIIQIPPDEIQGRYGFVEFWFEHANKELLIAHVPIQDYLDNGKDKTGAELLEMFSSQP